MMSEIILETKIFLRKILDLVSGKQKEFKKLSKLPRYTPGEYSFKNAKLEFPDAASFVFTYRELFGEQIYKFQSKKKEPLIIDCGANIGLSVIYFKEQFPNSKIIAFEPERTIFSYLKKNIESLGLTGINLQNKAVWSKNEVLSFRNEGADASRIAVLHDENEGFKSFYEVEAVKLSDYIDQEVDLLKLDIEGAEVKVIEEIEPKLKFVRNIFIEYHSFTKTDQELDHILNILSRNNFHYYIDSPNRMKRMPFVEDTSFLSFDFFLNIYAVKNQSSS